MYVNSEGEKILVGVTSFTSSANFGGCHSGVPAGKIYLSELITSYKAVCQDLT